MTAGDPRVQPSDDAWQSVLGSVRALAVAAAELKTDRGALLDRLRGALRGVVERHGAFMLLGVLDTDYTGALLPELVEAALNHGDALKVRQLLGRLPRREAEGLVPPAVWAQLQKTDDDDAYRRMAELLDHLGLRDALRLLCENADLSADEAVREVADDFRP